MKCLLTSMINKKFPKDFNSVIKFKSSSPRFTSQTYSHNYLIHSSLNLIFYKRTPKMSKVKLPHKEIIIIGHKSCTRCPIFCGYSQLLYSCFPLGLLTHFFLHGVCQFSMRKKIHEINIISLKWY
jgi:hypothetical protein